MEMHGTTREETQTMASIRQSAHELERIADALEGIEKALNRILSNDTASYIREELQKRGCSL